jgi:UDP-N-acetylmuramoylalanine--D-glutamate ligase
LNLSGANTLVVGMAKSGLAATALLVARGAHVMATDRKPVDNLTVPFQLQSPEVFEGRDLIVLSPGVPADLPEIEAARQRGVPVIGEVELASYYLKGPILGITGSNGKTTTTALTGHILSECGVACQVGGNIGTPPTAMVDSSRDNQWNVLELSSFQLETVSTFRPRIGVALNVTPNHLNRHHTFEAYAAAKSRLFAKQTENDFKILNADDLVCVSYAGVGSGNAVWFSRRERGDGVWFDGTSIVAGGAALLPAKELQIRGLHNVENTLAAFAAALLTGANPAGVADAASTFEGVEHRLEYVATVRGVDFYNDSKATSVDATAKALDVFDHGVWLILGGEDKGAPYTPLASALRSKASAVLTIGAAADKIARDLDGAVTVVHAGTLDRAVAEAFAQAQPGDTVLLAPACASFDQFSSYEHRGRAFKEIVATLQRGASDGA